MKGKDKPDKSKSLLLREIGTSLFGPCGVKKTDRLVLGLSGGADSTAMFHLLTQIHPPSLLHAVYVDHQLRPDETAAEIALLKRQCSSLGLAFTVCQIDVNAHVKTTGDSVEDAARKLRYDQLLMQLTEVNGDKICVAHTADDQIEEFFIRLIRGTGTTGLSGMKAVSQYIVRPLLTIHKAALVDYLHLHQISYSEDSSNKDLRYLRNRVRHCLLPFLQDQFHGSVGNNVLRTTAVLQDEDDYLEKQTKIMMHQVVRQNNDRITIRCASLLHHHIAIRRRIIEKSIWSTGIKPSFSTINKLCELARSGERGKEVHLPGGLRAVRQADSMELFFPAGKDTLRKAASSHKDFSIAIHTTGSHLIAPLQHRLTLSWETSIPQESHDCLVLNGKEITFPLTLRSVEPGDTFQPLGMQGTKKVNRFLTDKKIEKLKRQNHPILLCQDRVLCVVGLQIDERCRYGSRTKKYLVLRWQPE